QWQTYDLLRHSGCKCVHQTRSETDRTSYNGKCRPHHTVISEGKSDRHRQRIERICRLSITEYSEYDEDRIEDTHDGELFSFCLLQDHIDPRAESPADFQQIDGTGTDKERSHDRSAIDKSGIYRLKIIHKRDRRLV